MQYKVNTVYPRDKDGPDMEFTAKDDLAALEIGLKFAKMHKALGYQVSRKSRSSWHNLCTDQIMKAIGGKNEEAIAWQRR